MHSIISTRVVLHTARVLRQDIADSRATVAQNQWPSSMRFAEVVLDAISEDVELQEIRR